jgi:hypothetical protein
MKTPNNTKFWDSVLDGRQAKRRKAKLNDLPSELRGPTHNRYGGHQAHKMKPLKGSTFGPANEGRSLTAEEIAQQEERLRGLGLI